MHGRQDAGPGDTELLVVGGPFARGTTRGDGIGPSDRPDGEIPPPFSGADLLVTVALPDDAREPEAPRGVARTAVG